MTEPTTTSKRGRKPKLETPGLDTKPIPPAPTPATAEPVADPIADTVPQKLVDSTQPLKLAKVIPVPPEDEDEPQVRLIPGNRFNEAQRMGDWVLTPNGWVKG